MSNIKLSIVVPVYNAEKYLRACIESVLKQSFREMELILVDDGSKDNSLAICNEYAENADISVRVIHQSNSGSSIARKTGAIAARGEYIGFVDADDYVAENMYERMVGCAEEHRADIVMCGITYLSGDDAEPLHIKIPAGVYTDERLADLKANACMDGIKPADEVISPSLVNKIIRRDIVMKHMQDISERLSMGDDWAVSYPCFWDATCFVIMDECFYFYRHNTQGITKSYNVHMWRDIHQLYDVATRVKQAYQYPYESYYQSYFRYMVLLCLVNETYRVGDSCFWRVRNRLKQELNREVCQYALHESGGRFLSGNSNVLMFLAKYHAFSVLTALLIFMGRRKERM